MGDAHPFPEVSGNEIQVVWFKRDLRLADHAPLRAAAAHGPVWLCYIFEPSVWRAPDMDALHWEYVRASLCELREASFARGAELRLYGGEAILVLEAIRRASAGSLRLWSHEETGNRVTFARDRAVRAWAREQGVLWTEFPHNGVVRRLRDRDGWARHWREFMRCPVEATPGRLRDAARPLPAIETWDEVPSGAALGLSGAMREDVTPGGRRHAEELLDSFLLERGRDYSRAMSSPVTAYRACSRLSAPLAWGCLSMREVVQRAWARREVLRAEPRRDFPLRSLQSFLSRCHWHCHFMQKLETEPEIEFRCFHRGYEALRERGAHPDRLAAWEAGMTGYPFVDACLRALRTHGWINFRMRAMLVSFAAYHLWVDWRDFAPWLSRQFVDYEPGIHFSQVQMQSGVTGINTLRIYNPVKQGYDHDPGGEFIRRYVPELRDLRGEAVHEPWKTGGVVGYPLPLVEHVAAVRSARASFSEVRRRAETRTENRRVYQRHGSRAGPVARREGGEDPAPFSQWKRDAPLQAEFGFSD
ncbi:MAG: deoxyribodipyrimidine photo-lyase/cryptochrome family protein [Opitutales bacterium]